MPDEEAAGHLFPLYAHDRAAGSFLTPLFGHWRSGGTRYQYFATPLVGTFAGESRGFWLFPLGERYADADKRVTRVLWGRHERRHDGSATTTSFFPVYHRERCGDSAPLRQAMDTGVAPREWPVGRLGWETDWLLFLGGGKHWTSAVLGGRSARPDAPAPTPDSVLCSETRLWRLFPLWDAETRREATFAGPVKTADRHLTTRSALLWLYDYRREVDSARQHDYVRHRVLWRLLHYERLNGNTTMDLFPAVTWDRRVDGRHRFSFLWRLIRSETDAEGRRTLDLLFLPVRRP